MSYREQIVKSAKYKQFKKKYEGVPADQIDLKQAGAELKINPQTLSGYWSIMNGQSITRARREIVAQQREERHSRMPHLSPIERKPTVYPECHACEQRREGRYLPGDVWECHKCMRYSEKRAQNYTATGIVDENWFDIGRGK